MGSGQLQQEGVSDRLRGGRREGVGTTDRLHLECVELGTVTVVSRVTGQSWHRGV